MRGVIRRFLLLPTRIKRQDQDFHFLFRCHRHSSVVFPMHRETLRRDPLLASITGLSQVILPAAGLSACSPAG
jgi:hypothetical protein